MLAVYMSEGDLQVWRVTRHRVADEPAMMIQNLENTEISKNGRHWIGWSKKYCIIQYSES